MSSFSPVDPSADGWLLSVRHRSGYRYASPVFSSYNEARVTPRTDGRQHVRDTGVQVEPAATVLTYTDYFGSRVTAFDIHTPHTELTVTSTCVVDTAPRQRHAESVGWAHLREPAFRDRMVEYLTPTVRTRSEESLQSKAEDVRMAADPQEGALLAAAWVHQQLEYVPGTTGVHTSAAEALAEGKGVCQDFAQVTLSLLRAAGIPGRYVSGYLHPQPSAPVGQSVTGQSHAWVEWWAGDWRAFDPTNNTMPGPSHVVIARGRDYGDVPPLKGLFHGGKSESLGVSVEVTRLR